SEVVTKKFVVLCRPGRKIMMVKAFQAAKARVLLIIVALCLLAACDLGQNAPAANNAQATVVALSTENARLMTAVAKQPGANAAAAVAPAAPAATVAASVPVT